MEDSFEDSFEQIEIPKSESENPIKQIAIPVPESTPQSEFDNLIAEDRKQYVEYLNAIRDYIINNINRFSTKSLIKAMETYYEAEEEPPFYRIKQAIDVYKYCKEHPNDVEENNKDFILGVLFVCNFVYCSYNSGTYMSAHDKFSSVDDLLAGNKIAASFGCGGYYCVIEIIEIGRVLKLLIPEFNVPQPKFHYRDDGWCHGIDGLHSLDYDVFPEL